MEPIDWSRDLDAQQLPAAMHLDGPAQVVAGPGSGKTRTLTYRIAILVRTHRVNPQRILALTFTKKAAQEMKQRLEAGLLAGTAHGIRAGTIHGWCYRFLKLHQERDSASDIVRAWSSGGPGILQAGHQFRVWSKAHERAEGRITKPAECGHEVEAFKNAGTSWRQLRDRAVQDHDDRLFEIAEVWRAYREIQQRCTKKREGLLDFEDLLLETALMLEGDSQLLAEAREDAEYVLVDEAQDLNPIQWRIVQALAPPPDGNLMVVGDEDQAIYAFRGASPEDLVKFDQIYTASTRYVLDRNYRSTEGILEAANRLIACNQVRYGKRSWTQRGPGASIQGRQCPDPRGEAEHIVRKIEQAVETDGLRYEDAAILVRCWWQTRSLEDALLRHRIPYIIIGGPSFYGRREIRDILAYLELATNPDADQALQRIFNVPNRYLGNAARERLERTARRQGGSLYDALHHTTWPKPYMKGKADELAWCIQKLYHLARHERPTRVIEAMLTYTKYRDYLAKDPDAEDRIDNVKELLETAQEFDSVADLVFYAEQIEQSQQSRQADADAVELMTVHRAKGKEFRFVAVAGFVEGIMPHHRADDHEEERRIAFVALTRAEDVLLVTMSERYRNSYHDPSPYLFEAGLATPEDFPLSNPSPQPQDMTS